MGGEVLQSGVAPAVPALVRPLQLDEEAVAPERAGEADGGVRVVHGEPVPRAAGQADEPFRMLLDEGLGDGRAATARDLLGPRGGCLHAPR